MKLTTQLDLIYVTAVEICQLGYYSVHEPCNDPSLWFQVGVVHTTLCTELV